jgi:CP family cyanate transporter-like MFS transporter
VGNSWRLAFVFWAMPLLLTVLLFFVLSPKPKPSGHQHGQPLTGWWPDWKSRQTWLLGIAFGSNNSIFYGINAFVPDYLNSLGRPDLVGAALAWCNGSQLIASLALLLAPDGFQLRRWPYLIFGPLTVAALIGLISFGPIGAVVGAGLVGFATSVTFTTLLALPALISAPADVHRTAAGTFTISYSIGVMMPIVSGAIWDLTGRPWLTFLPLILCAVMLTAFGLWVTASARRPAPHAGLPE